MAKRKILRTKVSEATALELQAAHNKMCDVFNRENDTTKMTTTDRQFNIIKRIEMDLEDLIKSL